MLELALKFVVIGLILGMGVIEWGLDNRWHDRRTKTRQRRARTVIVLLIIVAGVDSAVMWRTHGQEQEERERAVRIEEDVQTLVELARERDPTLTDQEALKEIGTEIQALRGRTTELENELKGVKRYGSVAKLNMVGTSGKAGDGIGESNSVLPNLEDAYTYEQRDGETHATMRCDKEGVEIFYRAAEIEPDFPFSHFALAICIAKKGKEGWQGYAAKAMTILEHTTEIAGHHKNHDWALNGLRDLFNLQRQEAAIVH